MKANRFRRFTLTEVILHGLHAVIYLVLFVTGLVLILQRSLEINLLSPEKLSLVHSIMGVVLVLFILQILFLSFITPSFRVIWKTISEALNWRFRDIIWLIKIPFHFLFHRISLPESGKFNPGQKLNILVVLFTVTGLCISGVWMLIVPDALIAWYIHVISFKLGAIFLGIHLFLSLINPSTRKSITGMITGYVSLEYMKAHHPLYLKEPVLKEHHIHVYRLPAIFVGFVLSFILLVGIYLYGAEKFVHQAQRWARSRGMLSLMPGPLVLNHAEVISEKECMKCHNLENSTSSDKCLVCHESIAERINNKSGYHGGFSESCMTCHKEHQGLYADIRPFDKEAFNHQQTNFNLKGKHTELDCEQCHQVQIDNPLNNEKREQIRYINKDYKTCQSCHADPHNGQMSSTCSVCHSEHGWKGKFLLFSHNEQVSYQLDTLHAGLSCSACHKETTEGVIYRPLEKQCELCHGSKDLAFQGITDLQEKSFDSDPHWNRVACIDCHNVNLSHQSTKEFADRCISCHNDDYGKLFYNWLETFNINSLQAEGKVQNELIEQINAIGFHNIKMSSSIWNDILKNNERLPEENSDK